VNVAERIAKNQEAQQKRIDAFLALPRKTGIDPRHRVSIIRWDSYGNLVTWEESDGRHRIYNGIYKGDFELIDQCEKNGNWAKMQEILLRFGWDTYDAPYLFIRDCPNSNELLKEITLIFLIHLYRFFV